MATLEGVHVRITSDSFKDGKPMPSSHSADGEGSLPPLDITDIPSRTVTIAITAHDPDIPRDRRPDGNFDHWVVWNLPRDTTHVASATEHGGTVGTTTIGTNDWVAAGPPPGDGPHRYYFTVYALDSELDLPESTTRAELEAAIAGHVIESAELMGTYER